MNEVMDALVNRRSVRKYKAEAVPEELVKEIVEAGLYAPSGMGYQRVLQTCRHIAACIWLILHSRIPGIFWMTRLRML